MSCPKNRKHIYRIMLCLTVLAMVLSGTALVFAASNSITIAADTAEPEPGDTVSFTVTIGPVSDMGTMQMKLVIPEGLTYVEGSGKLADGLKKTLGYDIANFTEESLMVTGGATTTDYSSDSDTLICTFECKVDEGFKGTAEVGLTKLEFFSVESWKDHTKEYSVKNAVLKVGMDEQTTEPGGNDQPTEPGNNTEPGNTGNTDPSNGGSTEPANEGSTGTTPGGNDQPAPGGNTDPASGNGQTTEPGNSGNTEPAPGGNDQPGQEPAQEPSGQGGTTEPAGQDSSAEPAPSGNTEPGNNGNTTPAPGENTTPAPSGQNGEGTKTADSDGKKTDGNSAQNNTDGKTVQEPAKQGSERPSEASETKTFPIWVIPAVVVIAAICILLAKRKKDRS